MYAYTLHGNKNLQRTSKEAYDIEEIHKAKQLPNQPFVNPELTMTDIS